MHNEGAPRHHAGAPGPLLYLKPRCERVHSRAQRIRSPGSLSPEKPPPREAPEPLRGRTEFLALPAPPRKGSPELGRGRGRRGRRGRGRGRPSREKAGSAQTRARRRRGSKPGRKEPPRSHNGFAGAEQNALAAPRSPAAPPRPRGPQPPGTALSASRHRRGPTGGALCGCAFLGSHRSPSESRPSASSGAAANGAHGFMKTLMQEVGSTGANFSTGSVSAAPRASSPFPSSPSGRRCPRWWQGCWAAAVGPAGGPCRALGSA